MYHLRWGLETGFRDLKYTLGLVNLHGKSDSFAEQEIYANLTAFNFASRVCQKVVVRQPKEGVYALFFLGGYFFQVLTGNQPLS